MLRAAAAPVKLPQHILSPQTVAPKVEWFFLFSMLLLPQRDVRYRAGGAPGVAPNFECTSSACWLSLSEQSFQTLGLLLGRDLRVLSCLRHRAGGFEVKRREARCFCGRPLSACLSCEVGGRFADGPRAQRKRRAALRRERTRRHLN